MSILDAIRVVGVGEYIHRPGQTPRCSNMETLRNLNKEDANATDWQKWTDEENPNGN